MTIHSSSLANYSMNSGAGQFILNIEQLIIALAEIAVPLFFIISGVLFYRNYTYKKTISKYKSRFFSLVIPYLFWNVIWTIFNLICSYTFISNFFIGREKVEVNALSLIKGIFLYDNYGPLWFIFNLIVFSLFCPLIYSLLKNRWVGICVIIAVYAMYIFGIKLPEQYFFRADSIIFYLVGAYIGIHHFESFTKKKSMLISICSIFVFLLCVVYTYIYKQYYLNSSAVLKNIWVVVIILFCFSFWFAFDLLKNDGYFNFQTESFLIYAMHYNVMAIVCKLISLITPDNLIFAVCNYIITFVISVLIICTFAWFVRKHFPKFKKVLSGR